MSQGNGAIATDARRLLAERVASSRYLNRSVRLRDLLLYLTDRAVDGDAGEVHEQEVGHAVFGRPANYDTTSDNIVRVHASMLRKRLDQYFAAEGAAEPLILEIPKGNYAPHFREREEPAVETPLALAIAPAPTAEPQPRIADWRIPALVILCLLFAASTAFLLWNRREPISAIAPAAPTVRMFWSQVFQPARTTDIVLDDAAVGLFQELTGKPVSLSDYFDRDYLRSLPAAAAAANLDPQTASEIVLKRQASYSNVTFLWKIAQIPGLGPHFQSPRFARDYSFRELKSDNALLLGTGRANPWIEPFEPKMSLHWAYDKTANNYYPVDLRPGAPNYQHADGYFSIALLPNLGSGGNVLIVSSTGGSAINAGAEFLADEKALAALRQKLPASKSNAFPYFEALVRIKGRGVQARDANIAICRTIGQ
jgi:hypothetical protein